MAVAPSSPHNAVKPPPPPPPPPPAEGKKDAASSPPPPKATDKKDASPGTQGKQNATATPVQAQGQKDTFSPGTPVQKDAPKSNPSSVLNQLGNLAEAPPDGRVTLFDTYGPNADFHGNQVNNVVASNVTQPTSVKQVDIHDTGNAKNLNEEIENFAAGNLDATSNAIDDVLKNPGNTKVINQSQGVSPVGFYSNAQGLVQAERSAGSTAEKPGRLEQQFKNQLGLADNVDFLGKEGTQALTDRIEQVFQDSPKVAAAKERYAEQSQKLEDAGILHVVAVGNENRALKHLDELGVTYGKDATNSLFVNDKTITVGATKGDDQIADFSVSNPEVDVAADGLDVDVGNGKTSSGTSFSAPQVSAVISDLFAINPNLTNNQVRDILRDSARKTGIPDDLEGAGILDPAKARQFAQESLTAVTEL